MCPLLPGHWSHLLLSWVGVFPTCTVVIEGQHLGPVLAVVSTSLGWCLALLRCLGGCWVSDCRKEA